LLEGLEPFPPPPETREAATNYVVEEALQDRHEHRP
jgi:hypothetical protein